MMAGGMENEEFWLPSEFLADDFIEGKGNNNSGGGGRSYFPYEMPCEGFGSNLSSQVESVTETESDEEDYMAGLTRRMAHAFLQDDDDPFVRARGYPKIQAMSRSPQSTLCDLGIWSDSNKGSPNGPSQVSSPPSTPLEQHNDASWDLLAAAAGQVVQLRLSDRVQQQQQQQKLHGRGLLGPLRKPTIPIPAPPANSSAGYYTTPLLTAQQLQAERFYQLRQQQLMKQHLSSSSGKQQSRGKGSSGGAYREGRCGGRLLGLPSSAWPPLQRRAQQQPQPGSGMRAVFLTNSGTRRESVGTGVFLPRRPDNPAELRKKPACSTVLLPDRVVRALNVNLDDMGAHPRFTGGYHDHHDAMIARGDALFDLHNRSHYRQPPSAVPNHELRLPAEWTY